jgi:hypothetical protein
MPTDTRIDNGQVAEALRRVLASRTFARSERLRSFLKFVVEMEQLGLAHQLKGYTIGIDVFSRDEGFDPGTDPLVRVQAGKLRRLLNQFYAEEGRNEPLRIRIPLGGYVPVYEQAGTARRVRSEQDGKQLMSRWRGLPQLVVAPVSRNDEASRIFLNALRLWTGRLWAVAISEDLDAIAPPGTRAGPIDFMLEVKEGHTGPALRLTHIQSGREILDRTWSLGPSDDIIAVAALANQFAAATLTIPGSLYQFCHKNALSTAEMKCLDATYRYSLDGTVDTYVEARRHQQQWLGLSTEAEIITEIPRLVALSFQRP